MSEAVASESQHWYARDGSPCYEVPRADGKGTRPATLRDARKLDLVPSVTKILQAAAKPGLEAWKLNQVLMAALTLPRLDGEDDEAFSKRIVTDSKEQGKAAADRGTQLHTAIELYAQGKPYDTKFTGHIANVNTAMKGLGLNLSGGKAEHTFAHPDGFGGKIDWHNDSVVVDFKSKDRIEDGKQLAWDEHLWQLGAYRHGLGLKGKAYNIFVGVEDAKVKVHEWSEEELDHGMDLFRCLLTFCRLRDGI